MTKKIYKTVNRRLTSDNSREATREITTCRVRDCIHSHTKIPQQVSSRPPRSPNMIRNEQHKRLIDESNTIRRRVSRQGVFTDADTERKSFATIFFFNFYDAIAEN